MNLGWTGLDWIHVARLYDDADIDTDEKHLFAWDAIASFCTHMLGRMSGHFHVFLFGLLPSAHMWVYSLARNKC